MGGGKSKHLKNENALNHWNKKGELGAGSYGAVFALERRTDRLAAAGKLATVTSEDELIGFANEIELLAMCDHKGITKFIDAYFHQDQLWIIIEKCTGGSFSSILDKRANGLTEPEVQTCAYQLLDAVQYLHSLKIIHRDINAANTLLGGDGVVKLADFGVSAFSKKNKQSTFIGSPMWMAPEVIKCETDPKNVYTNKCDVWSLGITLIEFADGVPPNHDLHPAKAIMKITAGGLPKLKDPSKWTPTFSKFLSRILVRDPTVRPAALELLADPFTSGQNVPQRLKAIVDGTSPSRPSEPPLGAPGAPPAPPPHQAAADGAGYGSGGSSSDEDGLDL